MANNRIIKIIVYSLIGLVASLGAMVNTAFAEAVEVQDNLPSNNYFTAEPDLRRCASPMCGGAWVSLVNRKYMRCPNGKWARRCYVWDVEFDAVTDQRIVDGKTLIHGSYERTDFGEQGVFHKLKVDGAYSPLFDENPRRGFLGLVTNTGIVCITQPCPTLQLQKLNSRRAASLSALEFTDRFSDENKDEVIAQTFEQGALVFGHIRGPKMSRSTYVNLVVSNGYLSIEAETDDTCGGLLGLTCGRGEYCSYTEDAMCGFADQTGTCQTMPEMCIQVYDPVCGCDGVTYSNSCTAAAAGTSVLHEGECRQ